MEESSSEILKKIKNNKKIFKKSVTDLDKKFLQEKIKKILVHPQKGIKILNSNTTNNINKTKNNFQKITPLAMNKKSSKRKNINKKDRNQISLNNFVNKEKYKTLKMINNNKVENNNITNYGIEDLKKYVKLQMNKLQIIKPPNIYNFIKKQNK